MDDIQANFIFEENEPINATFEAYNEPPSIEIISNDYNDITNKPSINDVELVGNKTLDDLGIQPVGNYATKDEIPSLDDYVKNTDYAGIGGNAGVIKVSAAYGFALAPSNGYLAGISRTLEQFEATQSNAVISKGTLENIKDDYVKRGVTANTIELSADEKASAKQWLGYADSTDIMQAIASIPQFSLSIVEALPTTGSKMTLYLVPKEGTNNDVYDEYIWIEQTSSFEHLGTTAVDLTDYVKKTDYATTDKGGVVKQYRPNSFTSANGLPICTTQTLDYYNSRTDGNMFIGRGTLENIKNDLVKRAITTNDIELTDDEKTSARTWLGAVGDTDYATATKAGILTPSSYYATAMSGQYLYTQTQTLDQYKESVNGIFVGKGTLDNVLTQYSKTVLTTESDYNALETKDANTLYLIEE